MAFADDEKQEIDREFNRRVNLAPKELEQWLQTDESQSVGWSKNGDESVGHESGRKIVVIKRKRKSELTDDDYAHMKKVVGYVKRHSAQPPSGDVADTRWRYSLMNWGHDPLREG
jgi:hypothetical protein